MVRDRQNLNARWSVAINDVEWESFEGDAPDVRLLYDGVAPGCTSESCHGLVK